jgi:TatD DNase family protein
VIDTHCHLNFDGFDADRAEAVARAAALGVTRIITPAIDLTTCQQVLDLALAYPGIYAAVGVHPNSTVSWSPEHVAAVETYSRAPKVVAIGEIGLDYHWDTSPHAAQWHAFEQQLALAATLGLPVIVHNRKADADIIRILETWTSGLHGHLRDRPGVLHSFSGDEATAERALSAGFYLGFTGPLTYRNADSTRRIAASVPLERLLVETDAPFLTPIPHRGKRNEPAYIPLIVERLAALRGLTPGEMGSITTRNAETLFALPSASS